MVILDSDFLIKILRGKPESAILIYKYLVEHEIPLSTTIFNYAELLEGAYLSHNVPKSLEFIESFLKDFSILPFCEQDARKFGQTHAYLRKNGTPIGDFDVGIASICLRKGEMLLTRNKKHFKHIPLLHYRNWDDKELEFSELG